jgi:hypothetical protein
VTPRGTLFPIAPAFYGILSFVTRYLRPCAAHAKVCDFTAKCPPDYKTHKERGNAISFEQTDNFVSTLNYQLYSLFSIDLSYLPSALTRTLPYFYHGRNRRLPAS